MKYFFIGLFVFVLICAFINDAKTYKTNPLRGNKFYNRFEDSDDDD